MALGERLSKAWNAFKGRDPTVYDMPYYGGYSSSYRPDRIKLTGGNDKSIISSVYGQIAVDCMMRDIRHIRTDENGDFKETINSSLNYALNVSANIDQSGKELIEDAVLTMLDEGVVALVPVRTDVDPSRTDSYNVMEIRVGHITEWFPDRVRMDVYNDSTGIKESIEMEKRLVAIIQNPFYVIMNEPNSTAKRLNRVLSQLDQFNSKINPSKLDLIIQVPYSIRTEALDAKAKKRKKSIEDQLNNSALGIAYADGTEKIIQLNRSLENNLWEQAKDLQDQLFNQLGLTKSIFDGSADEQTMLNYMNRTITPILVVLTEGMKRKWLSKTALSQGQSIRFFDDPFRLVPVAKMAEIADKFTRNEIMSSNELRAELGMLPSSDPKANELRNSNLNHPDEKVEVQKSVEKEEISKSEKGSNDYGNN